MAQKILRLGIVGLGRIGLIHLNSINSIPNAVCTSVAVNSPKKPRVFSDKFPKPKLYSNYEEVIDSDDVDGVLICSPTSEHADQIIRCAEAGKPFFCEKPLSIDFKRGEQVKKIVQKTGTFGMMGFHRRFDPDWVHLKTSLNNGKIGQLHTIQVTARDRDPPSLEYAKKSGGLFTDMSVHDFDIARFLVDSEIVQVYAVGRCMIDPELGKMGDVDTSIVTLCFSNGVIGTVTNSRRAVFGQDQRAELFGSDGMIQLRNWSVNQCTTSTAEHTQNALPMEGWQNRYAQAYTNEIKAFVDSVLEARPSPCSVLDAQKVAAVAAAAKKSVYLNRPIDVDVVQ